MKTEMRLPNQFVEISMHWIRSTAGTSREGTEMSRVTNIKQWGRCVNWGALPANEAMLSQLVSKMWVTFSYSFFWSSRAHGFCVGVSCAWRLVTNSKFWKKIVWDKSKNVFKLKWLRAVQTLMPSLLRILIRAPLRAPWSSCYNSGRNRFREGKPSVFKASHSGSPCRAELSVVSKSWLCTCFREV